MSTPYRPETEARLALRRMKAVQRADRAHTRYLRRQLAKSHRMVQARRVDEGLAELRDGFKTALAYALIPLVYRVAAWWNRVRHGR